MKFTDRASEMVKNCAADAGISEPVIRITIEGIGCSGFTYGVTFVDEEEKCTLEALGELQREDGFAVAIEDRLKPFLEEVTVDYVVTDMEEGFKFTDTNVDNKKTKCDGCTNNGCGTELPAEVL